MADIKDLKITEDKTRGKHVADLPVNPTENGMSAQELQGHFDALPKLSIEAFNDLVDALEENGAGDKITPQSVGARPNANLLHNWYFGNPVNRNGKTEYAGYGVFTIDRWKSWQSTGVVKVNDGFLSLSSNTTDASGRCYCNQSVSSKLRNKLEGNVCTLSFIARTNMQNTFSIPVRIGSGASINARLTRDWNLYTYTNTATFGEEGTYNDGVLIFPSGLSKDDSIDILAIKLELGDTQTLAHQDSNGNWVLNEIPDYAEQMAICQQYNPTTGAYIGGSVPLDGSVAMSGNALFTANGYGIFEGNNQAVSIGVNDIASTTDFSNCRLLVLYKESIQSLANMLQIWDRNDGINTAYHIFGEHNKPSGSYTGNGSATKREIAVGGIGMAIAISSGSGNVYILRNGGFASVSGSMQTLGMDECNFKDGILTIKTNKTIVNENGTTYFYQVL